MGIVWAMMAAAVLGGLALLAFTSRRRREYVEFARRRLLIGACLCAASFVGACRRVRTARPSRRQPLTKLSVMARLGGIWREMGRYARRELRNPRRYEALGDQMQAALKDMRALANRGRINADTAAALQIAFRRCYYHTWERLNPDPSCYEPADIALDLDASARAVEEQTKILNDLSRRGTLPPDAVQKARAVIARQVAFQVQAKEIQNAGWEEEEELHERYKRGDIEPTDATTDAARILVDFTTNKPAGAREA